MSAFHRVITLTVSKVGRGKESRTKELKGERYNSGVVKDKKARIGRKSAGKEVLEKKT